MHLMIGLLLQLSLSTFLHVCSWGRMYATVPVDYNTIYRKSSSALCFSKWLITYPSKDIQQCFVLILSPCCDFQPLRGTYRHCSNSISHCTSHFPSSNVHFMFKTEEDAAIRMAINENDSHLFLLWFDSFLKIFQTRFMQA